MLAYIGPINNANREFCTMSYQYVYNNHTEYWVSYRGTRNGAYIRASSAHAAK